MRPPIFRAAGVLALLASAQAQAAEAKVGANCLNPEEIHGMVAFFLPGIVNTTIQTCAAHLPADAFLRAKGPALLEGLNAGKDAAWPMAKTAFGKFGDKGQADKVLGEMPDELLRPFVEAAVTAELAPEIDPKNCNDVNRIAATLEPLPAQNFVALIAEIMGLVTRGERKLMACPTD